MEAVIVVLLTALLLVAGGVSWVLVQRRETQTGDNARLEQHLEAMSQAAGTAQQTLLGQVNALDVKLNERLGAVQSGVEAKLVVLQSSVDQRLDTNRREMNQRLDAVDARMGMSLTNTQETIGKIGEQLGALSKTTQQMLDVGRDISSLQEILRPPKMRGGFGELLLERLLEQVLPEEHYAIQHRFPSGVLVDAAVRLGNGIVPVDSKFPLDAFHRMLAAGSEDERSSLRRDFVRAVRKHIDAVTKYILPEEGTYPFALMYIPAENVYYEVIIKDDLADAQADLSSYALERRVIPVSPNSFYAYLQAIVLGLKGMRVEERAHEIIRHLEHLSGEYSKIQKDFSTLGSHIKNANERYADVDRSLTKFGDRLQLSLGQPRQAPLPDPQAAPAPSLEPAISNGGNEPH